MGEIFMHMYFFRIYFFSKGPIFRYNKINYKYKLPQDLYSELVKEVKEEIVNNEEDVINYCKNLPVNLKNKLIHIFYKRVYRHMFFLQGKPNQFLNWIQPFLHY